LNRFLFVQLAYVPLYRRPETAPVKPRDYCIYIFSSVKTTTGYWLDEWGSIPGRGLVLLSSPPLPDRPWGSPSLLFNGYRDV